MHYVLFKKNLFMLVLFCGTEYGSYFTHVCSYVVRQLKDIFCKLIIYCTSNTTIKILLYTVINLLDFT